MAGRTIAGETVPMNDAQRKLVEAHIGFITAMSCRVARKFPAHVEYENVISYGYFGLIDAAKRFDPSLGWEFTTFAGPRITGAVYDELRKLNWLPRSIQDQNAAYDRACSELSATGGDITIESLAATLFTTIDKAMAMQRLPRQTITSLDESVGTQDDGGTTRHDVISSSEVDPAELAEEASERDILRSCVDQLGPRERNVVAKVYFEGMLKQDVAADLAATPGRVSQILKSAHETLRVQYLRAIDGGPTPRLRRELQLAKAS